MIKVLFVGDSPSKTNVSQDIAFVGARCFPKLVDWIKTIQPDYYVCLNSSTQAEELQIYNLYLDDFRVIALGKEASKRLDNIYVTHLRMPHPSGLNRETNDKELVDRALKQAYAYVRGNK